MKGKKQILVWGLAGSLMMIMTACQAEVSPAPETSAEVETSAAASTEPEDEAAEASQSDVEAIPILYLTDALSSTINEFELQGGTYEWNYRDGEESVGIIACGAYPPDMQGSEIAVLRIPDYNKIDAVYYAVGCEVMPERIAVKGWLKQTSGAGGDGGRPADEIKEYVGESLIELKKDFIYEITAEWDQAEYDNRNFFGSVSYLLSTE